MSNGKGDTPRPLSVDREVFASNWDKIFSNTADDHCHYSGLPSVNSFEDIERGMMEVKEKIEYFRELNSGMFFEIYPNLTGEWDTDKSDWMLMKLTDANKQLKDIQNVHGEGN